MRTSSELNDPWETTESDGSRHGRAEHALGGSSTTAAASISDGASTNSGPLVGRIDRSDWTQEDIELLLDILQILALLAAAYAAYEGT